MCHRLANFAPSAANIVSDTDDENEDDEFYYNEAQQDANESSDEDNDGSDDEDGDRVTQATQTASSAQEAAKRTSTSQVATAPTSQLPPTLPPIPIQRPTCCICTSVDLIDPMAVSLRPSVLWRVLGGVADGAE